MSYLLRKTDVVHHFGDNNAAVGRAFAPILGTSGLNRVSIFNWPAIIPEIRARQLIDHYPELKVYLLDPVTRLTAAETRARLGVQ